MTSEAGGDGLQGRRVVVAAVIVTAQAAGGPGDAESGGLAVRGARVGAAARKLQQDTVLHKPRFLERPVLSAQESQTSLVQHPWFLHDPWCNNTRRSLKHRPPGGYMSRKHPLVVT